MENENAAEAPVQPLTEQPFAVINERLQRAWENALVVSIQSSDVYGGNYSPQTMSGSVRGGEQVDQSAKPRPENPYDARQRKTRTAISGPGSKWLFGFADRVFNGFFQRVAGDAGAGHRVDIRGVLGDHFRRQLVNGFEADIAAFALLKHLDVLERVIGVRHAHDDAITHAVIGAADVLVLAGGKILRRCAVGRGT